MILTTIDVRRSSGAPDIISPQQQTIMLLTQLILEQIPMKSTVKFNSFLMAALMPAAMTFFTGCDKEDPELKCGSATNTRIVKQIIDKNEETNATVALRDVVTLKADPETGNRDCEAKLVISAEGRDFDILLTYSVMTMENSGSNQKVAITNYGAVQRLYAVYIDPMTKMMALERTAKAKGFDTVDAYKAHLKHLEAVAAAEKRIEEARQAVEAKKARLAKMLADKDEMIKTLAPIVNDNPDILKISGVKVVHDKSGAEVNSYKVTNKSMYVIENFELSSTRYGKLLEWRSSNTERVPFEKNINLKPGETRWVTLDPESHLSVGPVEKDGHIALTVLRVTYAGESTTSVSTKHSTSSVIYGLKDYRAASLRKEIREAEEELASRIAELNG